MRKFALLCLSFFCANVMGVEATCSIEVNADPVEALVTVANVQKPNPHRFFVPCNKAFEVTIEAPGFETAKVNVMVNKKETKVYRTLKRK